MEKRKTPEDNTDPRVVTARRRFAEPDGFKTTKLKSTRAHTPQFKSVFSASLVRVSGHDPSSSAAPRSPKPTRVSKPRSVPALRQSGLSHAKPLRPAPPPPPRPDIIVPKRTGQSVVSADRNSASIKTKPLSAYAHAWSVPSPSSVSPKERHPLPIAPPFPKSLTSKGAPSKPLKSISKTRIALATDIRSEGGTAEVLGLFLQQHGTGYTSVGDRELARGLEVSPQKAWGSGGAKGPRYLSGGLAERASRTIHRYQMSSSLWYKEASRRGISIRHSSPDLKMRIHRVLNIVYSAGRTKTNVRSCLAVCRVLDKRGQEGDKMLVLFALPHPSGGEVKRLEESELGIGRDVCVWKPWHTVSLSNEIKSLATVFAEDQIRDIVLCTRFLLST
ncbi:hypothetical protein EW146_g2321 [Bondarzewia mesenterica]|uniref:Uncharacterized protein n=1 Tax=Bondarzewia mesenterica TaxID=1095465 RepID=A0A4S4M123_9AGAM|nr:hypothetical protein EW146_g2321 [Bondarzewia mesenterica]